MEFNGTRGRIIDRQVLQLVGEVFSEVWLEESHRLDMLDNKTPSNTIESSTLVAGSNYE